MDDVLVLTVLLALAFMAGVTVGALVIRRIDDGIIAAQRELITRLERVIKRLSRVNGA